jgi:ABC-type dipeptide/oligopeptide/nickel transport system permease subunit
MTLARAALARRLLRTRLTPAALVAVGTFAAVAILAGTIAPYDPVHQDYASVGLGPSLAHWFGTDHLGRDLLSRLIHGARISLGVGAVSVAIGVLAGTIIGVGAGLSRGRMDDVLMRATDAVWAFPGLMLALAITSALGRGATTAMIAIGVVNIPLFARLARASTLTVRELEFVTAARALGVSPTRLAGFYVLPNILSPITVQGSLAFANAIITEAALSFLGVGVQPPTPSWGVELRYGYQYLQANPAQAIFPGLVIFVAVLAFNFLGDGLRAALDPRLRQRDLA